MVGAGIDYGRGTTNIDTETGIRFGVTHGNEVGEGWFERSEPIFPDPACPKCSGAVVKFEDEKHTEAPDGEEYMLYNDYTTGSHACESCRCVFDEEDVSGDDAIGYAYDKNGIKAQASDDGYIMVLKSPYYTECRFCSPCYPGAGDLGSPQEGGVKTYCFGHDWYEGNKAPFPVFDVKTGEVVNPE